MEQKAATGYRRMWFLKHGPYTTNITWKFSGLTSGPLKSAVLEEGGNLSPVANPTCNT